MTQYTPHDICAWAGRQVVGDFGAKAVLIAMARRAGSETRVELDFATLIRDTELSERSLTRAVNRLVDKGFVERQRPRGGDGRMGRSNYRLKVETDIVVPAARARAARRLRLSERRREFARRRPEIMTLLIARDGPACARCASAENLSVDHVISIAAGGTDDPENLQILCLPCNIRKGARLP